VTDHVSSRNVYKHLLNDTTQTPASPTTSVYNNVSYYLTEGTSDPRITNLKLAFLANAFLKEIR